MVQNIVLGMGGGCNGYFNQPIKRAVSALYLFYLFFSFFLVSVATKEAIPATFDCYSAQKAGLSFPLETLCPQGKAECQKNESTNSERVWNQKGIKLQCWVTA